ncbi:MAG: VCBS repeat-containing protein [Candidatus Zixiibacteriota bacterium]
MRRSLIRARIPELRLLCGLRFFEFAAAHPGVELESYLREFVPTLADSAAKCHPHEFLPAESDSLQALVRMIHGLATDVVHSDDLARLNELAQSLQDGRAEPPPSTAAKDAVRVVCLFVEYYPDLDLPPRGRLLQMQVTATVISSKIPTDDIIVRNPTEEPDDRFLSQARDSIKAARDYLHRRFGLSLAKRYRFDFAVDSTGARLTGDSLGAAFAVGAVAAIGRIVVFSEDLAVQPGAVLCGALSSDGKLTSVDSEALRLKIFRAFHSRARWLAVPADHLVEAKAYAAELVKSCPGRTLEICGPETIDGIFADQRLICTERLPVRKYLARRTVQAARSSRVQAPLLGVLILIFASVLADLLLPECVKPWGDCNPTHIVVSTFGFDARNKDSVLLWSQSFECGTVPSDSRFKVGDLDRDGDNEVAFVLRSDRKSICASDADLFVYENDGKTRFRRNCVIYNQYPGDTSLAQPYNPHGVEFFDIDSQMVIATGVVQSNPSRAHIRFWNARGDSLGWYVNAGWASPSEPYCVYDKRLGLVFLGTNNALNSACLFALNPFGSIGVSPPYDHPDIDLSGVLRGNQYKYVIFPRSEYCRKLGYLYNSQQSLTFEADGVVRAVTSEDQDSVCAAVLYYLTTDFRVIKVTVDDVFKQRRDNLAFYNTVEPPDWYGYSDALRDSVRHWTGESWVTEAELRAADGR